MIAVLQSSDDTGASTSIFNRWSRWLSANNWPPRPKNGSAATSARVSSCNASTTSDARARQASRHSITVSGSAGAHELAHAKHLHPFGAFGRLVPEAVRHDVEQTAGCRQASREQRIDGITGRRRQDHVRGWKCGAPILPLGDGSKQLAMNAIGPLEAVNGACQVGEGREVSALCEVPPVENRREAHDLGTIIGSEPADETIDTQQRVLEHGSKPVHAGDACGDQQLLAQHRIAQRVVDDRHCRLR